jgi:hypothetical protein
MRIKTALLSEFSIAIRAVAVSFPVDQTARHHTTQRHAISDDRSSRSANAAVPKYTNRKSDAITVATRATSAHHGPRLSRSGGIEQSCGSVVSN